MIPKERLEYLRELTNEATKGPWKFMVRYGSISYRSKGDVWEWVVQTFNWRGDFFENHKNNGRFIAESRTAIPELIEALEEAYIEIARLRGGANE